MSESKFGPPMLRLETAKLIERLKIGKPGDTVTDEELQGICGLSTCVGERGYSYLMSAIRHVLNNHGIIWLRRPKTYSLECLDATQTVELSGRRRKSIARMARRACRELATVDIGKIAVSEQPTFRARVAQLGTLATFAASATTKALESRHVSAAPDLHKLLAAFVNGNG